MNAPIATNAPLGVKKPMSPIGGIPRIPRSGVSTPLTNVLTTWPKARPMTTATARSMTLPRRMNSRNPLSISCLPPIGASSKDRTTSVQHSHLQDDDHEPEGEGDEA